MYEHFEKSFINELRLLKKSQSLVEELFREEKKIKIALDLAKEDSNMIKHLCQEIGRSDKLIEKLKLDNTKYNQEIEDLKNKSKDLPAIENINPSPKNESLLENPDKVKYVIQKKQILI